MIYNTSYDINVNIVYGCPASGKTTYVRNHMEDGDMVIDLDLIKQSISMKEKTNTGDNLLNVAIAIREFLYELVEYRDGITCNTIWIVAGLPTNIEREHLTNRLEATELIYIDATKDECIKRALEDEERTDKPLQMQIIDKWFDRYEPPTLKK